MEVLDFTFERRLELVARDSRKDTIFSLASEGALSLEKGAEKLQLSEEEFVKKMTEAGYQVPV